MTATDDPALEPPDGTDPARDRDVAVGVVLVAAQAALAAARLALLPARLIAQGPVVAPLVRREVDRLADAGKDAGDRGRRYLDEVPERVVDQFRSDTDLQNAVLAGLDDAEIERLVRRVLASPALERILQSPESERLLQLIVASPAVRAGLVDQSTGWFDEIAATLRTAVRRLDERVDARRPPAVAGRYAGLATRAVALAVDAVATHALYLLGVGVIAAVASLAGGLRPAWLAAGLAALGWLVIVGVYFVGFWTLAGQTPGMRLMRVCLSRPMGVGRSLARFAGLVLSIAPFFLGFASVPFDRKRRGLPDFIAGTRVVWADAHPDWMMRMHALGSRLSPADEE